ncbi:MAG: hypothetical protein LYZ70_01630 [Nitrososphaerales archaeon]|nr:hypothetical protein [Nitrososphaerales archaeon]
MLSEPLRMPNARFVRYGADGSFPSEALARAVFESLAAKQRHVAIIADEETLDDLPWLGSERLDPTKDYQWSGILVQRKITKPARRVVKGTYTEWFQWYMRTQRLRAFHTVVLIGPFAVVADSEKGGYIDGLLARLSGKAQQIIIVTRDNAPAPPTVDERRIMEVARTLLYGTRLTWPELLKQAGRTLVPIPREKLEKTVGRYKWRIAKHHPRLRLDDIDEELVQGMVARVPSDYVDGKKGQIEQLFERKDRFHRELRAPDEMLRQRLFEKVGRLGWVTVPEGAEGLSIWLERLNKEFDPRLGKIHNSLEYVDREQWLGLLAPTRQHVRRLLDGLVAEGRLERKLWFREIGRPALAYLLPGKTPFLKGRCGQCAFYVPVRRRCRLWWLVNKKQVFFDAKWKKPGSSVTQFELHKMKYASRIGPHSSACQRYIDKKRDHLRKAVPAHCDTCGNGLRPPEGSAVTCMNCGTKYVRYKTKVKVMTAYEHEYTKLYAEITGGDATTDLETWKKEMRGRLPTLLEQKTETQDLDLLADADSEEHLARIWPQFNQGLQNQVDRLANTSNIAKRFTMAMAESAKNATQRIIAIAKLYAGDVGPAIALQEKYLALIPSAGPSRLLTYEALVMREYWRCYGLALKKAQQWFGPRKRSRFVREFVGDPAGKARGYSALDAAINYLHQRRLRQAELINADVGFIGISDGFLHKEQFNSRGIGLLLDMIDPFKFADREELLVVALNGGISWMDFRLERDRRGSTFYYPSEKGRVILDQAGADADALVVRYQNREMRLKEAFREFATLLLHELEKDGQDLLLAKPFVLGAMPE